MTAERSQLGFALEYTQFDSIQANLIQSRLSSFNSIEAKARLELNWIDRNTGWGSVLGCRPPVATTPNLLHLHNSTCSAPFSLSVGSF
jgi:hypothetical protein